MAEQKTGKTEMEKTQKSATKEPTRADERRVFLPATDIYEQKDALAQEIRDLAIANLIERDGIRFVDPADA